MAFFSIFISFADDILIHALIFNILSKSGHTVYREDKS